MNDPLWKRDEMKEVRAARDRGDRSDRSIHPQMGYGGFTRDAWGVLRDCSQPGAMTRISEPLFGGQEMRPWSYELQPGDQLYLNGYPFFYPWEGSIGGPAVAMKRLTTDDVRAMGTGEDGIQCRSS